MKAKHIFFTILIVVLLFSAAPVHARLFSNNSESAYSGGDGSNSTEEATLACFYTIEELLIKGAEYYFKAHADINRLSEKVEVSDINGADYYTLWWAVNSGLDNISIARYYYRELEIKANQTPYNQVVINKLMDFDYDSFGEQNGLLGDVFSEVKSYLVKGDVRGVYSRTAAYLDSLTNILEAIKGELIAGKVPGNNYMWDLNQVCAKAHMFGQYIARVFYAIK